MDEGQIQRIEGKIDNIRRSVERNAIVALSVLVSTVIVCFTLLYAAKAV